MKNCSAAKIRHQLFIKEFASDFASWFGKVIALYHIAFNQSKIIKCFSLQRSHYIQRYLPSRMAGFLRLHCRCDFCRGRMARVGYFAVEIAYGNCALRKTPLYLILPNHFCLPPFFSFFDFLQIVMVNRILFFTFSSSLSKIVSVKFLVFHFKLTPIFLFVNLNELGFKS